MPGYQPGRYQPGYAGPPQYGSPYAPSPQYAPQPGYGPAQPYPNPAYSGSAYPNQAYGSRAYPAPSPGQAYPQPGYGQQQQYPSQPYPQPGYSGQDYPQQGAQQPYPDPAQQYPPQDQDYDQPPPQVSATQPLNTEQLEQLVAPIALYPDTLVAQILAAATYPAQVVDADHWRQSQGNASPDYIVAGANSQDWDPSIKAMTAFPQVLAEMDQNLRWTIALGNAYYNQPQSVLDVIQVMRQRAQAAGNLQSTPQEAVTYDQGYIQVAPANPDVVYLPSYDPWNAYGEPVQPYRGFSLASALGSFFNSDLGSGAVRYGLGIALSAFTHAPWGWLGWGLDWLGHSLLFQNSSYYSHSTTVADWGLPHGGPRARFDSGLQRGYNGHGPGNSYRPQENYNRGGERLEGRGGNGYNGHGYNGFDRSRGQAFEQPRRYGQDLSNRDRYRGYQPPGGGYTRPPQEAYNRFPTPRGSLSTPPAYNRPTPGYGFGFNGRPGGGFYDPRSSRPERPYTAPQQAYRAPAPSYPRGGFQDRFSDRFSDRSPGFGGGRGFEGYGGKPPKSGGFHLFGGGHEHQPKGYSNKGFGGGHSFGGGGGHSHGHGGGGHHR